jgi:hypothetical protein
MKLGENGRLTSQVKTAKEKGEVSSNQQQASPNIEYRYVTKWDARQVTKT